MYAQTHTCFSTSTSIAISFSSVTKRQVVKDDLSMLMNRSLAKTSNFFTSSPCTLTLPAMPKLENKPSVNYYKRIRTSQIEIQLSLTRL